jgi:Tol biopolymer transport system component
MGKLFQEIQRRKVFRVAAVYAVVAWLVIQVGDVILPTFNAPQWVNQSLIALLFLGFPITLVIGWAYELTPEGLKATSVHASTPDSFGSGQRITNMMLGLVLLAVGFLVVDQYMLGLGRNGEREVANGLPDSGLSRRYRIDIGETIPRLGPLTRSTIALSPDGSKLAYHVVRPDEKQFMYLLELNELEARPLPGLNDFQGVLFFSPDGEWLVSATSSAGSLYKTSIRGGAPQLLAESNYGGTGGYWSESDLIFYTPDILDGAKIMITGAGGGTPEALTIPLENDASYLSHAQLLPDGDSLLFTIVSSGRMAREGRIALYSLANGETRILVEAAYNARYVPSGHLVFMRTGSLWAVPFDLDNLEVTGPEVPVVMGVETDGGRGGASYSISNDGLLVYLPGPDVGSSGTIANSLVWLDSEGNEEVLDWSGDIRVPVVSPDGRHLAAAVNDRGNEDIWIYDLTRNIPSRLTFDQAVDYYPLWTPDGSSVVFQSSRNGGGIWRKAANGTGQAIEVLSGVPGATPLTFSPDGSELVFSVSGDLYLFSFAEDSDPRPLIQTPFTENRAAISPDGRWIAYESNESGAFEIYVRPFPDVDQGRWQVSARGGVWPLWHPDSQELFFREQAGGSLHSARLGVNSTFPTQAPSVVTSLTSYRGSGRGSGFDISLDGSQFLLVRAGVVDQNFFDAQSTQLIVVDNWFDELLRLAPSNRP